jgi:hypothetical protein
MSFIEDYEAKQDHNIYLEWEAAAAHPETRVRTVSAQKFGTTRHHWRPTEPSDNDWRLTNNDGACFLYLFALPRDGYTPAHTVGATITARFSIKLRGLDLLPDKSVFKACTSSAMQFGTSDDSETEKYHDIDADTVLIEHINMLDLGSDANPADKTPD